MAAIVVMANVRQVDRFGNAWHLIDIAQEAIEVDKITDPVAIALKVGNVNRIKAYQRGPQTQVGFGQAIAGQIAMLTEDLLQPRQRMEQRGYRFVISRL